MTKIRQLSVQVPSTLLEDAPGAGGVPHNNSTNTSKAPNSFTTTNNTTVAAAVSSPKDPLQNSDETEEDYHMVGDSTVLPASIPVVGFSPSNLTDGDSLVNSQSIEPESRQLFWSTGDRRDAEFVDDKASSTESKGLDKCYAASEVVLIDHSAVRFKVQVNPLFNRFDTHSFVVEDLAYTYHLSCQADKDSKIKDKQARGKVQREKEVDRERDREREQALGRNSTGRYLDGTESSESKRVREAPRDFHSTVKGEGGKDPFKFGSPNRYPTPVTPVRGGDGDGSRKKVTRYVPPDGGCCDSLLRCVNKIVGSGSGIGDDEIEAREKALAVMMIRFSRDGIPFTTQELKEVNEHAGEKESAFFNAVCYTFLVKALIRWILPNNTSDHTAIIESSAYAQNKVLSSSSASRNGVNIELPVATATARALELASLGYLTLSELFSPLSPYSIFASTSTTSFIDNFDAGGDGDFSRFHGKGSYTGFVVMRKKVVEINRLYTRAVLVVDKEGGSISNERMFIQFWKAHPEGETVPTFKRLYKELTSVYGGEEDSNDDDNDYREPDQELEKLFVQMERGLL